MRVGNLVESSGLSMTSAMSVRSLQRRMALAVCLSVSACADSDRSAAPEPSSAAPAAAAAADASMAPTPPVRTGPWGESSMRMDESGVFGSLTMHDVPVGKEDHVCVLLELPNDVDVWSRRTITTLTAGSHHFTLFKEPDTTAVQNTPKSCTPEVSGVMFAGTQKAESEVVLPEGIGHRFVPHQHLYVQLHYINTTTEPIDVTGTFELQRVDPADETLAEAQSALYPTLDISLPPHALGTARLYKIPAAAEAGKVRHVFSIASHTHRLGTHTSIERVNDADAPSTTPLYEAVDWDNPPLAFFDPPLVFSEQDGLRLICTYMNTTDKVVNWGTSATNEMCVLAIMFYDQ